MSSDLWAAASIDAEQELRLRLVASARVGVQSVWSFLASADNEADFDNRQAMVAERIDAAVADATAADPEQFVSVRDEVIATLKSEFAVLHTQRQAEAARKDAAQQLESFVAAEPDTRARVVAELARQADRDRATHPRYGDQTACRFCDQDIEYHGGEHGWIDRGGNRNCSEASGKHDQDGIPIPNKVQPHKPVSDRVHGSLSGRADPFGHEADRLSAEALDTEGPAHEGTDDDYHRGYGEGYGANQGKKDAINEYGQHSRSQHPYHRGWTDGYNDFETMSSDNLRSHMNEHHGGGHREGSFGGQHDKANETTCCAHGVAMHNAKTGECNACSCKQLRRAHGSIHEAKARCSFKNWGQRCALAAGHEGDHCRGFYNTPYQGTNRECACGHPERHVASLRTQAVGEPHTILTVQPKPASGPGALDGFEFVCSCGEKQSTSLSAEQARLMGARHVNFMNRNRGTASLHTAAPTGPPWGVGDRVRIDGGFEDGLTGTIVGNEPLTDAEHREQTRNLGIDNPESIIGGTGDRPYRFRVKIDGGEHTIGGLGPERLSPVTSARHTAEWNMPFEGEPRSSSVERGPGGKYTVQGFIDFDHAIQGNRWWIEVWPKPQYEHLEQSGTAATAGDAMSQAERAMTQALSATGSLHTHSLGDTDEVDPWATTLTTNYHDPDDARVPVTVHQGVGEFDELGRHMHNQINDMREKGITNKGQPATLPCQHCGSDANFDKLYASFPSSYANYVCPNCNKETHYKPGYKGEDKKPDPDPGQGQMFGSRQVVAAQMCKHCGNPIEKRDDPTGQRGNAWAEVNAWGDDRDFQCGMNESRRHEPVNDPHGRPSVYSSISDAERVVIGAERSPATQRAQDAAIDRHRRLENERVRGEEREYADQHGHDVSWMTAEERNAHDQRMRELDTLVHFHGGLQAEAKDLTYGDLPEHDERGGQPKMACPNARCSEFGNLYSAQRGDYFMAGDHEKVRCGGCQGPMKLAREHHHIEFESALAHESDAPHGAHDDSGKHGDGSPGGAPGGDGGGDGKPPFPPADDAQQQAPGDQAGQLQQGAQVNVHYVMPDGTKGECPATVQTTDGQTATLTYENGTFTATNQNGVWTDSKGATFTFDEGGADKPDPAKQEGPPKDSGGGDDSDPEKKKDSKAASLHTADKPRGDMDRSVAFTILLDLLPGYGDSADDGGSTVTQFLNDWYADPSTDMYEFARRWVGSHQAVLAAGGNPYLPAQNPYSVGTPPPAPSSSGETPPTGEQTQNAPAPEITQPMTTRPRAVPRSNTMPAGAPTDMNPGNAGTGTTGV